MNARPMPGGGVRNRPMGREGGHLDLDLDLAHLCHGERRVEVRAAVSHFEDPEEVLERRDEVWEVHGPG